MQFQFSANQQFQLDAIQAIADLFVGQPRIEADLRFPAGRCFSFRRSPSECSRECSRGRAASFAVQAWTTRSDR